MKPKINQNLERTESTRSAQLNVDLKMMIKITMTLICFLGVAIAVVARIEQGVANANSTVLTDQMDELRLPLDEVQRQKLSQENTRRWTWTRNSFSPIFWLGIAVSCCGVLGLIIEFKRKENIMSIGWPGADQLGPAPSSHTTPRAGPHGAVQRR